MHWILQNNIFKEEAYDNLVNVLTRFGISYSEHRVVPFVGTLIPLSGVDMLDMEDYADPALAKLKGPVICIGSYSMRHAAKKYNWRPGVFDLEKVGNFHECIEHWGDLMLNADSFVTQFKDISWDTGVRFVRPVDDTKVFAGSMYTAEEFKEWQTKVCVLNLDFGDSLTAETEIQVAMPKKIFAEYRCWVVDGAVVTMSLYKRGDKVIYINMDGSLGDEARSFANRVLQTKNGKTDITLTTAVTGWLPSRAFCLDVCETDEGWKIVEINTINSCGFYAANLTSLVLALENAFN